MKTRYITESGSIYLVDHENKTWQRKKGEHAADLRTTSGTFHRFIKNERDNYITLICPPINPPFPRVITTTRIMLEEDVSDDTEL